MLKRVRTHTFQKPLLWLRSATTSTDTTAAKSTIRIPGVPSNHVILPYLEVMLRIPDFPATAEDAENLLAIVRSRRHQLHCQKLAAEQAVYWSHIRLNVLKQKSAQDQIINEGLAELQSYRTALSAVVADLTQADLDVGVVRILLRRKGLPIKTGGEYVSPAVVPTTEVNDNEDNEGTASISDGVDDGEVGSERDVDIFVTS